MIIFIFFPPFFLLLLEGDAQVGRDVDVEGGNFEFEEEARVDTPDVQLGDDTDDLTRSRNESNTVGLRVGQDGVDERDVAPDERRHLVKELAHGCDGRVGQHEDHRLHVFGGGRERAEVQHVVDKAEHIVHHVLHITDHVGEERGDAGRHGNAEVCDQVGSVQFEVGAKVELPGVIASAVGEGEGDVGVDIDESGEFNVGKYTDGTRERGQEGGVNVGINVQHGKSEVEASLEVESGKGEVGTDLEGVEEVGVDGCNARVDIGCDGENSLG